eukprot:TRINITY_DN18625_c0_g1_i1.p1 TRINITY_DN18625_c0_g1~~TRINITY_DN18625_c0_g1_i1.p1  ORF type:complete len:934 (+),score=195.03 TRINITY_DN18625_c0_g1_i1:117-2804(+)
MTVGGGDEIRRLLRFGADERPPEQGSSAGERDRAHYLALHDDAEPVVSLLPPEEPPEEEPKGKYAGFLAAILNSTAYKTASVTSLLVALFGSAVFVLLDLPDDPTVRIADYLMLIVMVFFLSELVLRSVVEAGYWMSFLFMMDFIGTLSMIFEISFMLGGAGKIVLQKSSPGVNGVMVRAARAARLGARAGRLSKPMRCLSLMFSKKRHDTVAAPDVATALGERLTQELSTKVAVLTIVLVLGVPILQLARFPEDDFSLRSWAFKLEVDYGRSHEAKPGASGEALSQTFSSTVDDMTTFFENMNYEPFALAGFGEEETLLGPAPVRRQNMLWQEVTQCSVPRPGCEGKRRAAVLFDFTRSNQIDELMDVSLIVFIIVAMYLESFALSRSITTIIVKPVEKMLVTSRSMARLLGKIGSLMPDEGDTTDHGEDRTDEAAMLEKIFQKMAKLTAVFMEPNMLEKHEIIGMDDESKGVFADMMQLDVNALREDGVDKRRKSFSNRSGDGNGDAHAMVATASLEAGLPVAPNMDEDSVNSFSLNLLEMEESIVTEVVLHTVFDSSIGRHTGRILTDMSTWCRFAETVKAGYQENAYHNFVHGCDVLTSTYRLLSRAHWRCWVSEIESFALLVAAIAHDVGHPGRTNPFLIETRNEMALRYNDQSPLENMHCARLFEICQDPKADVLKRLDKVGYKQSRHVVICAILNTDNALHFDMVKEVKKVYEVNSALCNSEAVNAACVSTEYAEEVLRKNAGLWIKLFLHLADVSNPLKTFSVNKLWATRVVTEFFAQGDDEKRLGIPVGMLNDRDKVSAPGAEHGFINFLVAPLLFSSTHIFPLLFPCCEQLSDNVRSWRDVWVEEVKPPAEDIKKRDADVQKIQDQVDHFLSLQSGERALSREYT